MKYVLSLTVNGQPMETLVQPTESLLDVLRDKLDVTSPKRGCETGDCGGCTVIINGKATHSCMTIALAANGTEVTTVEGLVKDGQPSDVQQAFYRHGAAQCGFCTSGMVMSAKALLDSNPSPTREEIAFGMSGNLCRCGTYIQVAEAILDVASARRAQAEDNSGKD